MELLRNTTCMLVVALLFAGHTLSAQSVEIIGKWKTVAVEENPDSIMAEMRPYLEDMKMLMLTATFDFKTDGRFSFEVSEPTLSEKDAYWKYIPAKDLYVITEAPPREGTQRTAMEIKVVTRNGKIYFALDEAPLLLQVEKLP